MKTHQCGPRTESENRNDYCFELYPTSIGTAVYVRCNVCNQYKNITDYDTW